MALRPSTKTADARPKLCPAKKPYYRALARPSLLHLLLLLSLQLPLQLPRHSRPKPSRGSPFISPLRLLNLPILVPAPTPSAFSFYFPVAASSPTHQLVAEITVTSALRGPTSLGDLELHRNRLGCLSDGRSSSLEAEGYNSKVQGPWARGPVGPRTCAPGECASIITDAKPRASTRAESLREIDSFSLPPEGEKPKTNKTGRPIDWSIDRTSCLISDDPPMILQWCRQDLCSSRRPELCATREIKSALLILGRRVKSPIITSPIIASSLFHNYVNRSYVFCDCDQIRR
jgi:hypothetical protein